MHYSAETRHLNNSWKPFDSCHVESNKGVQIVAQLQPLEVGVVVVVTQCITNQTKPNGAREPAWVYLNCPSLLGLYSASFFIRTIESAMNIHQTHTNMYTYTGKL